MYTTALLLLVNLSMNPAAQAPTWLTNYAEAQIQGIKASRPLAVFVGQGKSGFAQCCQDGAMSEASAKLLADHFICVYLDAQDQPNKNLVEAFGFKTGTGWVLSDRSGEHQAFHHDGAPSASTLHQALRDGAALRKETPDALLTLTSANFETEVLKSSQPVLVDFFADWCGPCQRMLPVVSALGSEVRGIAKVGKLNTDQNRVLASEYGVSAIPAFLIFHEGRVVDRIVGATSKTDLAARIKALVK